MALKIYPVDQAELNFNLILYGPPGVGKTMFAAGAQKHPAMKDVLFLNVEGGLLSIRASGVMASDITGVSDLEALAAQFSLIHRQGEKTNTILDTVRTVVIDSGTELQAQNLSGLVAEAKKKKPERDLDDIQIGDYGKSTASLKRLFRMYRDLPINVIITALPNFISPKGGGDPTECSPQFTEKLSRSVMGYMDFVWYMYQTDDGKRHLLTAESGIFRAKTRGPEFATALGKVVHDPDLPTIYNTLLASVKPTTPEKEAPRGRKA